MLFCRIYRSLSRFYLSGGPGLHFDKAENVSVPSNQVDFAFAAWRLPVTRHNYIPQTTQMKISVLFTAPGYSYVIGNLGRID